MSSTIRDFNKDALTWDENPVRVKLANDISDAILKNIQLQPKMDLLDFGCGTGLLSLNLQSYVQSVTGVDSSTGMIDIFNTKIIRESIVNVTTKCIDIDKGELLDGRYDLVVSSMTFHHIKNIPELLKHLFSVLAVSGTICIADLDLENGKFHENNDGVYHNGFDRKVLEGMFVDAGLKDIQTITATEINKPARSGETSKFSVFLMMGHR
jgi:cyclopropane fatty-acyl-phospholipid synthase-like methyltransferase